MQVITKRAATVTENDSGGEYYEFGCFTDLDGTPTADADSRKPRKVDTFTHVNAYTTFESLGRTPEDTLQ